jgi:DNA-binding transcriptional MerR regulator
MASSETLFALPSDDRKKEKSATALRTISEASEALDVPQHVLRFWETKFAQIKPLKRNGGRRFYRPQDLEILGQIKHLLYTQGYTIKGAKKAIEDFARGIDSGVTAEQWMASVPPANSNDNQLEEPQDDILAQIADALNEGEEAPAEEPSPVASGSPARALDREALLAVRAELIALRHDLARAIGA